MGFGVKTWIFAAAAAVLNTAAMFYASIFGAPKQPYSTEVSPAAGIAVFLAGAAALAEYIYFGRKDVGRERIYRFVQHNVLSFLAAYGGFIIYCAAHFQDRYVLDTVVFNSMIPACFQRFFLITVVGWLVCGVISLVNKRNKKEKNLAEQQEQ
ncbi:MAG: hypothetical protein II756_03310 [Clostridia bacterium]|nr:hypothetical protein [Clostridia bacterium]